MATPFIAHWPGGIPAKDNGSIVETYAYLPDIMATLVDLAEADYPEVRNGHPILPMEGKSFVPVIRGESRSLHTDPICWEHEGNAAVRLGKWKLVRIHRQPWELYDLELDRAETHDVSSDNPDLVEQLSSHWRQWAERVGVMDYDEYRELNKDVRY
jgi:arylsulfatase